MDLSSEKLRRPRFLVGAGVVIVVLIALFVLRGEDSPIPGGGPAPSPTPTPGVEHAGWSFQIVPAGAAGRVTNRHRRAVEAQEEAVSAVVAGVNDALILGEGELADLESPHLTRDAARALGRSPLRIDEESISEALARRRRARIGVDVNGARKAVATSVVVARMTTGEGQVRVRYETTLWMERVRAGWRVFGFEGRRRRA